jgi:D-amino-acid dehydrogenase
MSMRVVVIGAGILGASTAWHLARAGASVTVVDAGLEGRATAAGAGIVCPWVSGVGDRAFYELYVAGAAYYPALVEALAAQGERDLGYRRCGALLVSDDPGELAALERFALGRRAGWPEMGEVSRLSPADASALFPPLRAEFGGVHVAGGARVDGRRMTASLLRAARGFGAESIEGVAEPVLRDGRVRGARVGGRMIEADRVVVTAGAWAPGLLRPLGIALPIALQLGKIMHLRLAGLDTADWPVVLPQSDHYLVGFEGGRIVVGATRETGAGFDYRVTAGGQAEVLARALSVAPGLGDATVIETRVGFRPVGPGVRPLLGTVDAVPGLLVGNGLGAAGLTIGPLAGRLLAEAALGEETMLDLAPFDPLGRHADSGAPALR